jgi:hypothetical protein
MWFINKTEYLHLGQEGTRRWRKFRSYELHNFELFAVYDKDKKINDDEMSETYSMHGYMRNA